MRRASAENPGFGPSAGVGGLPGAQLADRLGRAGLRLRRSRGRQPGQSLFDVRPIGGVRNLAQITAVAVGRLGGRACLLLRLADVDQECGSRATA